ncbi:MAG TPA: ASCH domain-containing protein [Methanocella sp.]|nr:ASCH domain-containing protein [Methanocella sp.]
MKKTTFWGRNEADDHLIQQVLRGEKTVTCSIAAWYYNTLGEEPTEPGDLVEVIDAIGRRRCVIRIERVYELPFGQVGEDIVKGECCESVDHFRAAHHMCWDQDLERAGLKLDVSTLLVVEHFRLVEFSSK